jgi:carbonic anhydrase/acetyltransferase-like protein (isoleucine patch superfamily)
LLCAARSALCRPRIPWIINPRRTTLIRTYRGLVPRIAATAYVDPQAVVIGDVAIGEHSSVWPCTVIRGDVHSIRIGAGCSIQDGSVLHVQHDEYGLTLGDNITVGHNVILHGCTIGSRCLIGMGSIILNGAKIGEGSIIAAGALIPERMEVPPGSVVMGQPGKIRRQTTAQDLDAIDRNAQRYVEYAELHRAENYK